MFTATIAVAVLMVAMWFLSLLLKNASIVDVGWGIGFVVVAWAVHARVDGNETPAFSHRHDLHLGTALGHPSVRSQPWQG